MRKTIISQTHCEKGQLFGRVPRQLQGPCERRQQLEVQDRLAVIHTEASRLLELQGVEDEDLWDFMWDCRRSTQEASRIMEMSPWKRAIADHRANSVVMGGNPFEILELIYQIVEGLVCGPNSHEELQEGLRNIITATRNSEQLLEETLPTRPVVGSLASHKLRICLPYHTVPTLCWQMCCKILQVHNSRTSI